MKIGVMGGSFNPIHLGHLNTAHEVAQALSLERVYFTVSGIPPHKDVENLIDSHHRYRMVELAVADNPLFRPSRMELDREGPSYTIDTMRRFRETVGGELCFIAGQDAIEDIGSWRSSATLLKTFDFAVATRPGFDSNALVDVLQGVLEVKYNNLKLKPMGVSQDGLTETIKIVGASSVIRIVQVTPLDISSSRIRDRLLRGRSVKYLVPGVVEKYLDDERVFKLFNGE